MPRVIFSTAEPYFGAARQELLEAFPDARLTRIGPDAGLIEGETFELPDVAAAVASRPIAFVRHLAEAAADVAEPSSMPGWAVALLSDESAPRSVSLQLWTSGEPRLDERPDALRRRIAEALAEAGMEVARGGREWVLSVLLAERATLLGLNRREHALADWPGGRVGLAIRPEQVSRSELKIEELLRLFPFDLPSSGVALDLGASPGGWTRLLAEAGMRVWAVDPADLDRRVAADPSVRHVRSAAEPFLARAADAPTFDLVANDMRMDPGRSCEVMLRAAERLRRDGLAIMTLKIRPRDALETVRACLRMLAPAYRPLHARQLFHNRNEVTLVARRR